MSTERDLIEQLQSCPETEILGVVSPSGVTGFGSGRSSPCMVLITLTGWRLAGSGFRKTELVVRKEVSDRQLKVLQSAMNAYDVVRVRARFAEENVCDSPQALLSDFIGLDRSDPELNAYALELQEPVTFVDPRFGLFTLDRQVNWYEAAPVWCGNSVRLTITAGTPDEMERSLAVARRLWTEEAEWQRRITAYATQELLGLKNKSWLDEDESEVTEEEFAGKIAVETISVEPSGSFEFWHDDGDLFLGHSIMVSGDVKSGPTDAGIHG